MTVGHFEDRISDDDSRRWTERMFARWVLSPSGQDVGAVLWEVALEHEKRLAVRKAPWLAALKPPDAPWRAPE